MTGAGITRESVIGIATRLGIAFSERRVSLAEFHCADGKTKQHSAQLY